MLTIAFHDNQLCERGTTAAVYDYAHYNELILKNRSIIMYEGKNPNNIQKVVNKFKRRFKVFPYSNWNLEANKILKNNKCDLLYTLKPGELDGKLADPNVCPTVVHCVFDIHKPQGTVYGRISPVVGKYTKSNYYISFIQFILDQSRRVPRLHNWYQKFTRNNYPVVPHIVNLPKVGGTLRRELDIPESATVFGRIGGKDQFNLKTVHEAIERLTRKNPDIYFLLVNTNPFCTPVKISFIIHRLQTWKRKLGLFRVVTQ